MVERQPHLAAITALRAPLVLRIGEGVVGAAEEFERGQNVK